MEHIMELIMIWSNDSMHYITHSSNKGSDFELISETPYLALTGMISGDYCAFL